MGNIFAAYWKDGDLYKLPNYPGTTYSLASGVVVAGSDQYIGGFARVNGMQYGVYWKNGVEETLTTDGLVGAGVVK